MNEYELEDWAERFQKVLDLPMAAQVAGNPVRITAIRNTESPYRGLEAACRTRSGEGYWVSLADVIFERGSPAARTVDAYREELEIGPLRPMPRRKVRRRGPLDLRRPLELVVHYAERGDLRARLLSTGEGLWLRNAEGYVPAEILTVAAVRQGRSAGLRWIEGEVLDRRVEGSALDLAPLELREDYSHFEKDEPVFLDHIEPWQQHELDQGYRLPFRLERVRFDSVHPDPLLDAASLRMLNRESTAVRLLSEAIASDARCLEAHHLLGHWAMAAGRTADALRHYQLGVELGEEALWPEFKGTLRWAAVDNRPFLRCLLGLATALEAVGLPELAVGHLRRILWINPPDDQGARHRLMAIPEAIRARA